MPTGGSVGFSTGSGSRTYTDTPTTIIANNVLDVYTGQTTFLLGAMLNSKAGKLKLDTGNFVFDHFGDKDFARNVSVQLNIDPNRPDANGSYYYHDKQGVTYATVGAGTIKIRNAPATSLIALNRDAANIQRVVKDETINIKIPGVNLVALVNDVNNSVNYFRALAADVPDYSEITSTYWFAVLVWFPSQTVSIIDDAG